MTGRTINTREHIERIREYSMGLPDALTLPQLELDEIAYLTERADTQDPVIADRLERTCLAIRNGRRNWGRTRPVDRPAGQVYFLSADAKRVYQSLSDARLAGEPRRSLVRVTADHPAITNNRARSVV